MKTAQGKVPAQILLLQLVVMDVGTKKIDHIPSLQSSERSVPPDMERGLNSIEINPSRTLLATGASNSNDIAVYRWEMMRSPTLFEYRA